MKRLFGLILVAGLAAAGFFGWQFWSRAPHRVAAEFLQAAVEKDPVKLGPFIDSPAVKVDLEQQLAVIYEARAKNAIAARANLRALKEFGARVFVMASHPEYLSDPNSVAAQTAVEAEIARQLGPEPPPITPRKDAADRATVLASPEGMIEFLEKAVVTAGTEVPTGARALEVYVAKRMTRQADETYAMELRPDMIGFLVKDKTTTLIFARDKLFRWRLVGVRLPKDGRPAID